MSGLEVRTGAMVVRGDGRLRFAEISTSSTKSLERFEDVGHIIEKHQKAGGSIIKTIDAVEAQFGVPRRTAKELVVAHSAWSDRLLNIQRVHDEAIKAISEE